MSYTPDLSGLEKALGYTFNERTLLLTAITHRSFHHENPELAPSFNERLEFLGDAVIALIITDYLFRLDTLYPESVMSKLKSYIVKGSVLSEIAEDISLGDYLRIGKGEEKTGGRHKESIMSDTLEAVIGAIYIDSGIETAKEVTLRLFKGRLSSLLKSGELYDYKSALQELSQMRFGLLPQYRLIKEEGVEHKKIFTVEVLINSKIYGRGRGDSKKEASASAAKEALENLK